MEYGYATFNWVLVGKRPLEVGRMVRFKTNEFGQQRRRKHYATDRAFPLVWTVVLVSSLISIPPRLMVFTTRRVCSLSVLFHYDEEY